MTDNGESMTENQIAAVKCSCGTITAANIGASYVICETCGLFHRLDDLIVGGLAPMICYMLADTDARPAQDRPMRPGWSVDHRFKHCSKRILWVTVNGERETVSLYVNPSRPGAVVWKIDVGDVYHGEDGADSRVAFGQAADEPAAQLAAESACREFARALLREVGE